MIIERQLVILYMLSFRSGRRNPNHEPTRFFRANRRPIGRARGSACYQHGFMFGNLAAKLLGQLKRILAAMPRFGRARDADFEFEMSMLRWLHMIYIIWIRALILTQTDLQFSVHPPEFPAGREQPAPEHQPIQVRHAPQRRALASTSDLAQNQTADSCRRAPKIPAPQLL